ncbi:MAG: HD-GYP domain-containing protein [Proteobacteria bacterium]|nr:HD-GYP domain-containing protein [Pseudomonadota bacterium]
MGKLMTVMNRETKDTERGKTLIYQLFVLFKTSKNYNEGHSAMKAPTRNLLDTVNKISKSDEEASLTLKGGYMLLGEERLKPDSAGFEGFKFLMEEMKSYYIGNITFSKGIKEDEIGKLPYIFAAVKPEQSEDTFEDLKTKFAEKGVHNIEISLLPEDEAEEKELDSKGQAKRLYSQTLNVASEAMEDAKMGKTLKLKKAKRAVQGMVDQLLTTETNLLGLTTIRCHDEYTFNHSVNVCILSLAIGQRIGLSRDILCQLGIAALFHDLGKADVPLEILNKPSSFDKEEWEIMQKHPVFGVRKLMQLKGLDALNARVVTGAFEHHLNYDLSGYPKVAYGRPISLFGSIISIADCYDGLTSSRVYSRTPHTPDEAINFMMARSGKAYDPVLMKLFVNCIGIYPVGSLLLLNTGEFAVIMENHPDTESWNTPKIKIISTASGGEIDGPIIDLQEESERSITRTLGPEKYGIEVSKYFT